MVSNAELEKLIKQFQAEFNARCDELTKVSEGLSEKIDKYGQAFESIDERLDKLEEKNATYDKKLEELDEKVATIAALTARVEELEGKLKRQEAEIPAEIKRIDELVESRTNRQLRKTLIFKNIDETKADESYDEVKELLAQTISENTDISYDDAFDGIDRAHRESPKADGKRQGKRFIYAAFLNWGMSQQILDGFRQRCIEDRTFKISADQMYGPITSRRRNLAFQRRKELKQQGTITSAYVDFPARLMVNFPGDVKANGKKVYKLHTNFSSHVV